MCGRFTLTKPIPWLAEILDVKKPEKVGEVPPRYNVSPGTNVLIVRSRERGTRELGITRWGLVPFWAKDSDFGAKTINARSETAAQKPAFRAAFRYRRCLIPSDGFLRMVGKREKKTALLHSSGKQKTLRVRGSLGELDRCGRQRSRNLHNSHDGGEREAGGTPPQDARYPARGVLCGLAEPGREPRKDRPGAS